MKNKMKTKHCPKCDSKDLLYVIDIFKKRNEKEYYTGEVNCEVCKSNFIKKEILIREWEEIKK